MNSKEASVMLMLYSAQTQLDKSFEDNSVTWITIPYKMPFLYCKY